jgi:hypothetical protein
MHARVLRRALLVATAARVHIDVEVGHPHVDPNRTRVPVARVTLVVVSACFVSNRLSRCPPHGAVERSAHAGRSREDGGTSRANALGSESVECLCVPAVRWDAKTSVGRLSVDESVNLFLSSEPGNQVCHALWKRDARIAKLEPGTHAPHGARTPPVSLGWTWWRWWCRWRRWRRRRKGWRGSLVADNVVCLKPAVPSAQLGCVAAARPRAIRLGDLGSGERRGVDSPTVAVRASVLARHAVVNGDAVACTSTWQLCCWASRG